MAFETIECQNCDETFTAYEDANAADNQYCSPRCEIDGKDL